MMKKNPFLFAQLALLFFFLMGMPAALSPHFHPDFIDAVRGFLLGTAIGLLILQARRGGQCTNFRRFRM